MAVVAVVMVVVPCERGSTAAACYAWTRSHLHNSLTAYPTRLLTVPPEDDKANAALYLRYMAKALEKGEAYVAAELERLTKMSEKPMSGAPPLRCVHWGHAVDAVKCAWATWLALRAAAAAVLMDPCDCLPPTLTPAPAPPPPPRSAAAKLDEISRKVSVLSSFTEEPEEAAATAAAATGKQAAGDDGDDEIEWEDAAPEAGDEADEADEEEEEVSAGQGLAAVLQRAWRAWFGVPSPPCAAACPLRSCVVCVP